MQQFFAPVSTPSVESALDNVVLSVEEEAMLFDELRQDHTGLQQTADELNQSQDFIEGMEDMLIVADTKPSNDEVTQELIAAVSEMATAGTDSEAILPEAMLSAESIEGIKQAIKRVWDTIVSVVRKLWEQFVAMFGRYQLTFTGYYKRLAEHLSALKGINTATAPDATQSLPVAHAHRNGSQQIQPAHKWVEGVQFVTDTMGKVLKAGVRENGTYAQAVVKYIKDVNGVLSKPTVAQDIVTATTQFIHAMSNAKSEIFEAANAHRNKAILGTDFDLVDNLPGDAAIYFHTSGSYTTNQEGEDNTLNLMRELTHARYELRSGASSVQEFNFPDLREAVDAAEAALTAAKAGLDYITEGKTALQRHSKDIQSVIDQMVKAVPDDTPTAVRQYITVIMELGKNFNTSTVMFNKQVINYLHQQLAANERAIVSCVRHYHTTKETP